MQAAYDCTLSMVVNSAQPITSVQQDACCPAAPIVASIRALSGPVPGLVQAHGEEAAPSLAQLQLGCRPAASAPARLSAGQALAGVPETLAHKAPATKPHAGSPRCTHGPFSHVSVVYDSGSVDCRSSSNSLGSSGKSLQNVEAGSVRASAGQQPVHPVIRSGTTSKSRLGEETQPSRKGIGNAVASGQKRQALSELRPQMVKHSQREQQAWTQCTDDSDDFV